MAGKSRLFGVVVGMTETVVLWVRIPPGVQITVAEYQRKVGVNQKVERFRAIYVQYLTFY